MPSSIKCNSYNLNITQMRMAILFHYHKNLDYWYKLLGEFYENTKGFTEPYYKRCTLDGVKVEITWDNSWKIKQL